MRGVWEWLFGNEPIRWVQELFGLGHPLPFRIFSLLGDTWGMLLVIGIAFWVFGRERFHATVAIVVAGAATKVLLSTVFHQTRPQGPGIVVYEHLEVSSFPSGHVYEALGPWGLLYAMGCVPLWVPALIAVLVSLGRIYLGTHYVGDVIGGVVLAVPLVWIFHRLWPAVRAWLHERGKLFYLGLSALVIAGTLAWMSVVGAHPRRYEIFGMMLGAAVGLPLEHRFLRYDPGDRSWGAHTLRVLMGTAGIAAFLLWDRSGPDDALLLGTLTAGLAALWVVLGAPALFTVFGTRRGGER